MTERRTSLASDAFAVSIGVAALHAGSLLSVVVLARLLAPAELGAYQQLFLLYGILSPLLLSGIPAALLYFLAQSGRAERGGWVGTAYGVLTTTGLVLGGTVLLAREPIARALNDPALADLLALWSPVPLLLFVTAVAPNVLVPLGRATSAGMVNVALAVLTLAGVAIGGAVGGTAEAAVVGLLASGTAAALLSVAVVLREPAVGGLSAPSRERARAMLAYGVPLALTGIAGMLGYQLDRVVVGARFSSAEYAIYALGAIEVPIATLVQQSVNNVLAPELTRRWVAGDLTGMLKAWQESIRLVSLLLLPVFTGCMVFADDIVRTLFGDRYEDSVSVFRIYLGLVPLRVATYGLIPMAIGRTGMNLTAAFVLLAANLALVLPLTAVIGLDGAAAAAVGSTVLLVTWYLVRLAPLLGTSVAALMPWRLLAVNLALAALAASAVAPVLLLGVGPLLRLLLAGILFPAVYLPLMRRTGRITDRDWLRLTTALRRLTHR